MSTQNSIPTKIQHLSRMMADEERKQFESAFSKASFRADMVARFIVAELCFQLELNPKLKTVTLTKPYFEAIRSLKRDKTLSLFLELMIKLDGGIPRPDQALMNITRTYITKCWEVPEIEISDPEMLGQFSIYLKQCRELIQDFLLNKVAGEIFQT